VVARAIEEAGIPTALIGFVKEHLQRAKPPRALWVPFPFGFALGKPNNPEFQHRVLQAALDLLSIEATPKIAEFPEDTGLPPRLVQANSAQMEAANQSDDAADEITQLRGYYERWVAEHDGRTMVGLSGIPQRRFRGLVRYLQKFSAGDATDYKEKPENMPVHDFIKLACDDLRAFYMEARMCQRPNERDNDLHKWFWSQTAMGTLMVNIAERLKTEGHAITAFGIAR